VPPVREQQVLPGVLIDAPPGPAAAVLVDAQVRHRRGGLLQHRVRRGGERLVRHRPGDPGVPGRLRRGDAPLGDLGSGLLPQPPVSRHRGGTCGTRSVNVLRRSPAHRISSGA
jgi:hypothetical protein